MLKGSHKGLGHPASSQVGKLRELCHRIINGLVVLLINRSKHGFSYRIGEPDGTVFLCLTTWFYWVSILSTTMRASIQEGSKIDPISSPARLCALLGQRWKQQQVSKPSSEHSVQVKPYVVAASQGLSQASPVGAHTWRVAPVV